MFKSLGLVGGFCWIFPLGFGLKWLVIVLIGVFTFLNLIVLIFVMVHLCLFVWRVVCVVKLVGFPYVVVWAIVCDFGLRLNVRCVLVFSLCGWLVNGWYVVCGLTIVFDVSVILYLVVLCVIYLV